MKTWIKALLPLTVLVLSLLLIFIAIAPGSTARTTSALQQEQGQVGCLGDKICEQDAELSRGR